MKFTAQEFAYILSALQVVERDQVAERRLHSRIEISGKLTVVDVASNTAYTALGRDICFMGLSLLQAAPPTVGAQVVVALPHHKNRPYRVRCTIVNVRELAEQLYCVGCAFAAAEPASAAPTPAAKANAAPAATPNPAPPSAPAAVPPAAAPA